MRRWKVRFAAACVVLAACGGDQFFGPSADPRYLEWEESDQVLNADLRAAQIRAEYEDEFSSELMQWVDAVWSEVYFEGRGLCVSCGPWGLGCVNYCEDTESEQFAEGDDTGCVGVGFDGPARVWCLLDSQFHTRDRFPDLDFEEWRAFMDIQCGR